jgi:O-mycaminosyltylonolide 6-deoxyallosyltransferase
MVTHVEFAALVTAQGLEFAPVPGSYQQLLATREGRRALGIPTNSPLGCLGLYQPFRHSASEVFERSWTASADAEGLICNALAMAPTGMIAIRRQIPMLIALVVPIVPSRDVPHPAMPPWPLGAAYNRLTYSVARRLIARGAAPVFRIWEADAQRLGGAAPSQQVAVKVLVPVSSTIVPPSTEWPSSVQITGFWFPPAASDVAPTADLRTFVEQGPPPLVFGFGSMADDEPGRLQAIVQETVKRLQARAVIVGGSGAALAGWAADHICHVPFVDYDWLFPRVGAVIHQGGVGTAAYALRAGVPQVTVPYCLDHAFWASRLQRAGVAPAGITRHRLTARRLTAAIRAVLRGDRYQERAHAVAGQVRSERGLEVAEDHFNRHFGIVQN